MITKVATGADWYEIAALWAPSFVALLVAVVALFGALLIRRDEARQARDEMTRRAAAEFWTALTMLLRAAVVAVEEGHPGVWNRQPEVGADRGAYDRYNDALQHAWNCQGLLAIWRPELSDPALRLVAAYMVYDPDNKKAEADAQHEAREEFLMALRRTLRDGARRPKAKRN